MGIYHWEILSFFVLIPITSAQVKLPIVCGCDTKISYASPFGCWMAISRDIRIDFHRQAKKKLSFSFFLSHSNFVYFLGSAIRCYECNSHTDVRCSQDIPPDELSIECGDHKHGVAYTFCRKITQVIEFSVNNCKTLNQKLFDFKDNPA